MELDGGKHEECIHFFEKSERERRNALGMQHDCRSVTSLHSSLLISYLNEISVTPNEAFINVPWIELKVK